MGFPRPSGGRAVVIWVDDVVGHADRLLPPVDAKRRCALVIRVVWESVGCFLTLDSGSSSNSRFGNYRIGTRNEAAYRPPRCEPNPKANGQTFRRRMTTT